MAKTFNAALSSDRDRVRLRIGDTETATMILEDVTIDALLASFAFNEAAAQAAEAIGAFYIRKAMDTTNGDQKFAWQDRAKAYSALAAEIRGSQSATGPVSTGSAASMMSHPDLGDYRTD